MSETKALTINKMRDHEHLESFLRMLRGAGVAKFRGGLFVEGWMERWDVDVSFFPSAPTELPAKTEAPAPDPELCRCGHSYHQHIDGLCGIGCDVEACAPKEG